MNDIEDEDDTTATTICFCSQDLGYKNNAPGRLLRLTTTSD